MFAIIFLRQGKNWVYKINDCNINIINPENIYLFDVNNWNTRKSSEKCSKFTIKTSKRLQWGWSGVFIVKFWTLFKPFSVVSKILSMYMFARYRLGLPYIQLHTDFVTKHFKAWRQLDKVIQKLTESVVLLYSTLSVTSYIFHWNMYVISKTHGRLERLSFYWGSTGSIFPTLLYHSVKKYKSIFIKSFFKF